MQPSSFERPRKSVPRLFIRDLAVLRIVASGLENPASCQGFVGSALTCGIPVVSALPRRAFVHFKLVGKTLGAI